MILSTQNVRATRACSRPAGSGFYTSHLSQFEMRDESVVSSLRGSAARFFLTVEGALASPLHERDATMPNGLLAGRRA